MYNNINGYLTKKDSLSKIVESVNPDILALCETKKASLTKKDELSEYSILEKNLKLGKEGLMVGVKKGSFLSIREITDTELKSVMTVKIEYPHVNLRVIVAHAPQETDNHEERKEFFEEMLVQVERGITSGDATLVLADFNARITHNKSSVVPENVVPENDSPNGKLLCDLIQKNNLKVGNFDNTCHGKWTRIQACKNGETKRSALDYVLLTEEVQKSLKSIVIDEQKIYCPYGVKKENGVQRIVFSDHCTITTELNLEVGRVQKQSRKETRWRYSEEGYKVYEVESDASLDFDLSALSTTDIYGSWVACQGAFGECLVEEVLKRSQ